MYASIKYIKYIFGKTNILQMQMNRTCWIWEISYFFCCGSAQHPHHLEKQKSWNQNACKEDLKGNSKEKLHKRPITIWKQIEGRSTSTCLQCDHNWIRARLGKESDIVKFDVVEVVVQIRPKRNDLIEIVKIEIIRLVGGSLTLGWSDPRVRRTDHHPPQVCWSGPMGPPASTMSPRTCVRPKNQPILQQSSPPTCIGAFFRTISASASSSFTSSGCSLAKFCDSVGSCWLNNRDLQHLQESRPVPSWRGRQAGTLDQLLASPGSGRGRSDTRNWRCPLSRNINRRYEMRLKMNIWEAWCATVTFEARGPLAACLALATPPTLKESKNIQRAYWRKIECSVPITLSNASWFGCR